MGQVGETSEDPVAHNNIHEGQSPADLRESTSISRETPIPLQLTMPSTPRRLSTADSSSSASSRSSRFSFFPRRSRSECDSPVTPISTISTRRPSQSLLPEVTECQVENVTKEVVPDSRPSLRLPLFDSSSTPQVNLTLPPMNPEMDIHQTLTSIVGEDRPSMSVPGPDDNPSNIALLVRENRGNVTAGTVEGLVEQLISDSSGQSSSSVFRYTTDNDPRLQKEDGI
jgi:hypothetical protein